MAKLKNNSPQAKRNRNNRKRGSSFEKKVAEILDMEVVPYSGTNSRFGWSDVRDSESKNDAWWLGECKNRVCESDEPFTIEQEWIDKMIARANDTGALAFLAFMKAGKPDKYVLIDHRTWSILMTMLSYNMITSDVEYERGSHNAKNIKIPQIHLNWCKLPDDILRIRLEGTRDWYYVMSIEVFRSMLEETNYHHKWAI